MASSKARSRSSGAQAAPVVAATPTSRPKPSAPPSKASAPASKGSAPASKASAPASEARPVRQPARPQTVATEAVAEPVRRPGPPLWVQLTSLLLALLGLAVSAYETYAHYNGNHLAGCATTKGGTFDCSAVITSPQSMVFGVFPVAVLGLAFYVFVVAIMTPWAWQWRRREVGWLRLAAMISGMAFVMYLIYAELYQIQQVCEYCSGVHIITFLLFCLTVFSAAVWGLGKPKGKAAA